jgi:hypothetical protein
MSSVIEMVRKFFGLSKDLDLMLLNERCVVPWAPWILALFNLKEVFTFLLSKFYNHIGCMCTSIIKIIQSNLYLRVVILEGV